MRIHRAMSLHTLLGDHAMYIGEIVSRIIHVWAASDTLYRRSSWRLQTRFGNVLCESTPVKIPMERTAKLRASKAL